MAGPSSVPSVRTIAIASVALYIAYRITSSIERAIRHRSLIRKHGCQPPVDLDAVSSRRHITYKYWPFDRMMGFNLGTFKAFGEAQRERRFYPGRMELWASVPETKTCRTLMANLQWTLTQDQEIVKHVMSTDFDNWGFIPGREHGLGQFLGQGIFTADGVVWQHSRNFLKPNFTRFQVSNIALFERHFQELLKVIPRDGSTINLSPRFFCMTMDIATEFLFGSSSESQGQPVNQEFSDAFGYCQDYGLTLLRLGKLGSVLPYTSKFRRNRKLVYDFVDGYVDEALEQKRLHGDVKQDTSEKGKYVALHQMVQSTSDRERLRAESLAMLLAGRDTTASTMTTLWFVLARYPEAWKKVQAEVATLQGQFPSFEQIKELKYLQAVINETLRLWSPVSLNSRVSLRDVVLPRGGGPDGSAPLFMPKGSQLAWTLYSYHRQKDVWGEDAEEFRPERWLGPGAMRFGWHYTPFNAGPRVCLGQQFALTQIGYITVRLCQTFEGIENRGQLKEWQETQGLIITHSEGATVSLKPREQRQG